MAHIDPAQSDRMLAPLCRRYLLVRFQSLPVRVDAEDGGPSDWMMIWALGALADGQHELVGTWVGRESCKPGWRGVFESLYVRGLKRIRFVASANFDALQSALVQRYPNATFIAAGPETLAVRALPPQHRCAVLACHEVADELQRLASRAIRRHGPFGSTADAFSFVAGALRRAEERLEANSVEQAVARLAGRVARRASERSGAIPWLSR